MIKSPLRYPGGKSRVSKYLHQHMPADTEEFREVFAGGASVLFYSKQMPSNIRRWVMSDTNAELIQFWRVAQSEFDSAHLVSELKFLFNQLAPLSTTEVKKCFRVWRSAGSLSSIHRAVRFFFLNRVTFSGTTESGGFSSDAYQNRFTLSSIARLAKVHDILDGVDILQTDFQPGIELPGSKVFLYLDPPYANGKSLYGKNGDLHKGFDHHRLADSLKQTNHKFLLSYDDTPMIRELYKWANIETMSHQYGMTHGGASRAMPAKDELLIKNY